MPRAKPAHVGTRTVTNTYKELGTFVNVALQRIANRRYASYATTLGVVLLRKRLEPYVDEFNDLLHAAQKPREGEPGIAISQRLDELLATEVELTYPALRASAVLEIWIDDDKGTRTVRTAGEHWTAEEFGAIWPFVIPDLDLEAVYELLIADDEQPDAVSLLAEE